MLRILSGWFLFCWSMVALAAGPAIVNMQGVADSVENHTGDGKWTLVMVWSTACVACQRETPAINAYNQKNADGRIRVVGLAINGLQRKAAIEEFRAKYNMEFPTLVADPKQYLGYHKEVTGRAFRGTPTFMVYDKTGRLAVVNPGPIDLNRLEAYLDANPG